MSPAAVLRSVLSTAFSFRILAGHSRDRAEAVPHELATDESAPTYDAQQLLFDDRNPERTSDFEYYVSLRSDPSPSNTAFGAR